MPWEFPKDRLFDLSVDGFTIFARCQWIEQDTDTVTVDHDESSRVRARVQVRLEDVRAVYTAPPAESTRGAGAQSEPAGVPVERRA